MTLAGLAEEGLPDRERIPLVPNGAGGPQINLVRVEPSGWLVPYLPRRYKQVQPLPLRAGVLAVRPIVRILAWPVAARAWGHSLLTLPPADLYHACGAGAAFAARALAARAQHAGRRGRVIYDMIDIFLEAGGYPSMRRWRRALYRRRESKLVQQVDGLTTVNDALADDAVSRWRLAERPAVVYNCPSRVEVPAADADLIRAATGIPPGRAIVLYIGRFFAGYGLLEAGDAVMRLPEVAFVAMGYGQLAPELRARDNDPARAGRHFTLPPVPPEEVARWAASADLSIFVSAAATLNLRLSTPNKLWESLAGGTPIVVGEDLAEMRRILEPEGLGIAARHDDPQAIANAVRQFLDLPVERRAVLRARARRLVTERYAWDLWAPSYLASVERIMAHGAATTAKVRGQRSTT